MFCSGGNVVSGWWCHSWSWWRMERRVSSSLALGWEWGWKEKAASSPRVDISITSLKVTFFLILLYRKTLCVHLFTHIPAHPLIYHSITICSSINHHSSIHWPTHPLIHWSTHSLIHWPIHLSIDQLTHWLIHWSIHLFIHPPINLPSHPPTHLLIYLLNDPSIHQFIHLSIHQHLH